MSYLRIVGRSPLIGTYTAPAAKNAVLPILASCVSIGGTVTLHGCPRLSDVDAMLAILRDLGAEASQTADVITVDCTSIEKYACTSPLTGCMRSSLFLLGSVLGRMGRASLGTVGGCVIGARPIDIHLAGLAAFGVTFAEERGRLLADAHGAHPTEFRLSFPSVGATVNLLTFALSLEGESVLYNVAIEPEVVDLIDFLRLAGSDLSLVGRTLRIRGAKPLRGLHYAPVGDRVVAATVLTACCMTGGQVTVCNVKPRHLSPLLDKIGKSSCICVPECDKILLCAKGRPSSFSLTTGVYPAFATDMQSLALAYDAVADGVALVRERVFESRFAVLRQLVKMGADITTVGNTARVTGRRLHGADVTCSDLRAGAALVCAGLAAEGISTIDHIGLIDRGYQCIEHTFAALGADITRIDER